MRSICISHTNNSAERWMGIGLFRVLRGNGNFVERRRAYICLACITHMISQETLTNALSGVDATAHDEDAITCLAYATHMLKSHNFNLPGGRGGNLFLISGCRTESAGIQM